MPGTRCTVALCNNSLQETQKGLLTRHIQYHRFPLDEKLCNVWKTCLHRDGKWNAKSCRICSVHFTSDDYERNLKAELLGLSAKKVASSMLEIDYYTIWFRFSKNLLYHPCSYVEVEHSRIVLGDSVRQVEVKSWVCLQWHLLLNQMLVKKSKRI